MKKLIRLVALIVLALITFISATMGTLASPAYANGNRAVINIGGNNTVIAFGGSINGIVALQMVASIETISYGGQGVAVCSINGVGNPAVSGQCLGESSGRYWSYWRAAPNANRFSYSGGGAGGTAVINGAVEGWSFGNGGPPPFTSFCAVAGCEPTPPPTSPPAAAPTPASTPAPAVTVAPSVDSGSKDKNSSNKNTKDNDRKTDAQPNGSSADEQAENGGGGRSLKPGSRPDARAQTTRTKDAGSPLGVGVGVGVLIIAAVTVVFIRRRRTAPRH